MRFPERVVLRVFQVEGEGQLGVPGTALHFRWD